jgi:hypothetical protein
VLEIADMVVQLRREHPRIVKRALLRGRLGVLPLIPETSYDQSQKRNDDGQHQGQ